jgi:predicted  nucleic acid-binding Zn-ribbon protein|uniref:Cell division protein ZapB n=1 Tax=Mesoaciditoga lauensis TaxID=1495039 RepID=A0A7V3REZ7_9BACT
MEDILRKLEDLIDSLVRERDRLFDDLKKSGAEVERLKDENVELKTLIHEQSVRVEALMKKLEQKVTESSVKRE